MDRECYDSCFRAVRAIYWQEIVDQSGARIGCESLIRLTGVPDCDTEVAIRQMSSSALSKITSELLLRISLNCILSPSVATGTPFKIFLNVEKQTLSCADAIDELIEASRCFKVSGYELVVEVTERPLPEGASMRMYIDGLIRLKRAGIPVALDDYSLDNDEHVELELGLVGLVKLEIDSLGVPLESPTGDFLRRKHRKLREQLYEFVRRYRVLLLAERVETPWQSKVVADLPFNYFQGYYFGKPCPAEDGLMPTVREVVHQQIPIMTTPRKRKNNTDVGVQLS